MKRDIFPAHGMTRCHLVRCGAASLALSPAMALAQVLAPPPAANAVATDNDLAQRLTVNAVVNGNGPYRFVVDTGADRTVLAEDIATSLGLLRGRSVLVVGAVRTLPSQTVTVGAFSVGPVTKNQLAIPVLPRGLLQADGYLGLDIIDGYRVTFDFVNHMLEINERLGAFRSMISPPNQTRIPVFGAFGHLRAIDCLVDGVRSTAFIDSGASVSVGNARLLAALQAKNPKKYAETGTIPLTGVTGGVLNGGVTSVDVIRLRDLTFNDCALVIADLQIFDLWGLSEKPSLLIGMNYLRQFARVSIDYGNKELRFDFAELNVAMQG